jgi:hypothetical protein
MMRRTSALLLVLLAVVGCGSKSSTSKSSTTVLSRSQYQARLAAANRTVTASTNALQRALSSRSATPATAAAAVRKYASIQGKLGDAFAGLEPPANAKNANQLLAKGYHDEAAEGSQLAGKLAAAKSRAAAVALLRQVSGTTPGGREVDEAVKELHGLGYAKLS